MQGSGDQNTRLRCEGEEEVSGRGIGTVFTFVTSFETGGHPGRGKPEILDLDQKGAPL